jgi:phage host-nuclease inhibitor protein Gam
VTHKETYIQKIKNQLDDLEFEIERLKDKAAHKSAEVHVEYSRQMMDLNAKKDMLHKELNELAEASDDAWEELKTGADNAWHELKSAVERARNHYS